MEEILEKLDVQDIEALEDHTKDMKMGIRQAVKDSTAPSRSLPSVVNFAVVLEEQVVMDNLQDYTNAFTLLGLLYALNIEYCKDLKDHLKWSRKSSSTLDMSAVQCDL
ncbi:hypothetical protein SRHO_G00124370 [Serrasalmus rhombeus]